MAITADELNRLLQSRLPAGLQIPPPCFTEMRAEPLDYADGSLLSLRFPVQARYQNPLGYMQGGFIVAAIDNTIGPFSYLVAPPSVTARLGVDYLRPVLPAMTHIDCIARLVQRTRRSLYLSAEVLGPDGKVIALCQATQQLLDR